jgi:rhamnulokinase
MNYYLAVDIGASSGRHIIGYCENGKIQIEEIHRFKNSITDKDGELCWNLENIFNEIKIGMKKCKELGKIPVSMGIDTWGVDFVLLDKENKVVGNTVSYRDSRTDGMDEKVYNIISEEKLYKRTGIQKQIFNTIYQIKSIKEKKPDYLNIAQTLLLIPDYLHFCLTNEKTVEYTNATTTQLTNPTTKDWDYELIDMLGFPKKIFPKISKAGYSLGNLTKEIEDEVGFNCKVVLPATHDTGSAVLAVPSNSDKTLYISSGTWSLLGIEAKEADCSLQSKKNNFTNEGGYDYRYRYLKNIMGLWMIQSVKKELYDKYTFQELCDMAKEETIDSIVSCNDSRFLAPENMIKEIQLVCKETLQKIPKTAGELAAVIYNSLALCYKEAILELEKYKNCNFDNIYIVGGGSKDDYLNKITAGLTKKDVIAGPIEATAIGNLLVQMLNKNEFENLKEARKSVYESFDIKKFEK